jgi:hypothetical protein
MSDDKSAFQRASLFLKLNGNDSGLSQMSYSVVEFDSIYQLYPKIKLNISDYEGVANEYLAFVDGTQIEVGLGASDDLLKSCKFIIAKDAVPQQKTSSNGIGGDFEVSGIHDYYSAQFKISDAYSSNISDIIRSLANKYKFNSVNVEDTINSGLWYQPFVTDSEFMVNFLSPFAFSNSSRNTPFFTFIDSNNNFNFKSFNMMFNSTPIAELSYCTFSMATIPNDKTFSSINFSQLELSKIRPYFNTVYYDYDENGNEVIENDSILDYSNTQGNYPVVGDSSNPTNIVSLYDYDVDQDDTENNNKGYKINLHREVILPDKVIVNTTLNKELVCGNTVRLNMPSVESNQSSDKSMRNSGIYLIESSYHIWDGHNARSTIICSKQNVKLTNDYRNRNLLYS